MSKYCIIFVKNNNMDGYTVFMNSMQGIVVVNPTRKSTNLYTTKGENLKNNLKDNKIISRKYSTFGFSNDFATDLAVYSLLFM